MVNISDDNQQADYIYLGEGSPSIRIIKLLKGENGGGTCYHEIPRCKENYGHRHSEEKTPNITVRDVIKSVEGSYRLYPYCLGSNHHCTTDQPLKSFMLFAEGKVRWLTLTFNSQKWLTCNFSLYYSRIIQQIGSENTWTHQIQDITLIEHQILITNLQGNV